MPDIVFSKKRLNFGFTATWSRHGWMNGYGSSHTSQIHSHFGSISSGRWHQSLNILTGLGGGTATEISRNYFGISWNFSPHLEPQRALAKCNWDVCSDSNVATNWPNMAWDQPPNKSVLAWLAWVYVNAVDWWLLVLYTRHNKHEVLLCVL